MNTRTAHTLGVLACLAATPIALAQTPAVTYQGWLDENTSAADGLYDLRFTMFDDATGGATIAGPFTFDDVTVENGLFTVPLDLEPFHFDGTERYLLIEVRDGASTGGFDALSPRQPFGAAGQALYALDAPMPPVDPEPQLLSGLPVGTTLTISMSDNFGNRYTPMLASTIRFATQLGGGGGGGGGGRFEGDGLVRLTQRLDTLNGWPLVYVDGNTVAGVELDIIVENAARGASARFRLRDARPTRTGYLIGDDGGVIEFVDLDLQLATLTVNRQASSGPTGARAPTHGTVLGISPGNGIARAVVDGSLQNDTIVLGSAFDRTQALFSLGGPAGQVMDEPTLVRTSAFNSAFDGVFSGFQFQFGAELDPSGFVLQPDVIATPFSITIRLSDDGLIVTEFEVISDLTTLP